MICPNEYEQSGLLCYPPCKNSAKGIGPVCWGYCPTGTKQCGVLCLAEGETCLDKISKISQDMLTSVGDMASKDVSAAVQSAAGVSVDFVYPICGEFNG